MTSSGHDDIDDEKVDLDALAAMFGFSFGPSSSDEQRPADALAHGSATTSASTSLNGRDGVNPPDTPLDDDEDSARQRRIESQRQRRGDVRWNYSGKAVAPAVGSGAKWLEAGAFGSSAQQIDETPTVVPAGHETNEQAMHRMLGGRLHVVSEQAADRTQVPRNRAFKRHMCTFWQQGHCHKGSNCTFAHGEEELAGFDRGIGASVPHEGPSWEMGPPLA